MKTFESKWGAWNGNTPNQVSVKSVKSPQHAPSGTNGTALPSGIHNNPDAYRSPCDPVQAKIYQAMKEAIDVIGEQYDPALEANFTAAQWREKKRLVEMSTDNPPEIKAWQNGWLRLLKAVRNVR